MMYYLKQELCIEKNVLKLVIYVTYNKTSKKIDNLHQKKIYLFTIFFINRMLILWCLKAYRYEYMLNINEKVLTY